MTPDEHGTFQELAAGYALHALEPDEEQAFLSHLHGCADCLADVARHQDGLAELAFALPGTPARGLREAIMDGIHAEPSPSPVRELQPRRRHPPGAWLLAAAASVAAVALAATTLSMRDTVQDTRSNLASLRAVLDCTAPRCTASWLASPDDQRHAVILDDGTDARLVIDALPRNDRAQEMYVLWQRDAQGRLTAVHGFDVTSSDVLTVEVPRLTPPYTGFAISREDGRALPKIPTEPLLLPTSRG